MPDGVNMSLIGMEKVTSVQQAMSIANQMGMPAQNAMLVDKHGNAGWTIFGKIPHRPEGDYRIVSSGPDHIEVWCTQVVYPEPSASEEVRFAAAATLSRREARSFCTLRFRPDGGVWRVPGSPTDPSCA